MRIGVLGCAIRVVAGPGGVPLNGCGPPIVSEGGPAHPSPSTIAGLGRPRGIDTFSASVP